MQKMFNVTILKLRDLIKFILIMILAICAVTLLGKIKFKKAHTETLGMVIPTIFKANEEQKQEIRIASIGDEGKNIINSQIASIRQLQNSREKEKTSENTEDIEENSNQNEDKEEVDIASIANAGVKTEVTTQNPLQDKYTAQYGSVKIKNETDYNLTNEILAPDITIENKNILIFHTQF